MKHYIKPTMKQVKLHATHHLLAASEEPKRTTVNSYTEEKTTTIGSGTVWDN